MTLEPLAAARTREGLDQHHYAGMASLRHALRLFLAFSDAAVRSRDLTNQEYQAMLVIAAHPVGEILARDLAVEMLLAPAEMDEMAARMEGAGLVERRRAPNCDDTRLLALTDEGESTLASLAAVHLNELMKHEPLVAGSLRLLRRVSP